VDQTNPLAKMYILIYNKYGYKQNKEKINSIRRKNQNGKTEI